MLDYQIEIKNLKKRLNDLNRKKEKFSTINKKKKPIFLKELQMSRPRPIRKIDNNEQILKNAKLRNTELDTQILKEFNFKLEATNIGIQQ